MLNKIIESINDWSESIMLGYNVKTVRFLKREFCKYSTIEDKEVVFDNILKLCKKCHLSEGEIKSFFTLIVWCRQIGDMPFHLYQHMREFFPMITPILFEVYGGGFEEKVYRGEIRINDILTAINNFAIKEQK